MKKLTKENVETGIQIEAVVPAYTTSKIYVPFQASEHFGISVNNKELWKDGKFIDANNKISYDSQSGDFIVFEFQAGAYVINAVEDLL